MVKSIGNTPNIAALLFHSTRIRSAQTYFPEFSPFFTPDIPIEVLADWLDIHAGVLAIHGAQGKILLLSPEGLIGALCFILSKTFRALDGEPDIRKLSIKCWLFGKRRNLLHRILSPYQITNKSITTL
jgi:hypothetical protein